MIRARQSGFESWVWNSVSCLTPPLVFISSSANGSNIPISQGSLGRVGGTQRERGAGGTKLWIQFSSSSQMLHFLQQYQVFLLVFFIFQVATPWWVLLLHFGYFCKTVTHQSMSWHVLKHILIWFLVLSRGQILFFRYKIPQSSVVFLSSELFSRSSSRFLFSTSVNSKKSSCLKSWERVHL